MAEELKSEFGATVKMTGGSGGIFDVVVEKDLVFSKHDLGRFPDPGEVVDLLKKM